MSHHAMRWSTRIGLAGVLLACAACGTAHGAAGHSRRAQALAVVNGQVLTVRDWKTAVDATDVLNSTTLSTSQSAQRSQVKALAGQLAVEQYALKHHWVTQSKALGEARLFVSENVESAFGGQAKTAAALKRQHLTIASLTQFETQQMILEAAFAHVVKNVPAVSTATAQAYYRTHQSEFTSPTQDKMRMILVKKKSLAESLMRQLEHGASWQALALKYSLDPASKNKGGEYGWVDTGPQSNFVKPFYEEMDKLKAGQYGIAHSQYGYHVIEVQAQRPGQLEPFTTVKAEIVQGLTQQKEDAAFEAFSQQLAKKSHIKYYG